MVVVPGCFSLPDSSNGRKIYLIMSVGLSLSFTFFIVYSTVRMSKKTRAKPTNCADIHHI